MGRVSKYWLQKAGPVLPLTVILVLYVTLPLVEGQGMNSSTPAPGPGNLTNNVFTGARIFPICIKPETLTVEGYQSEFGVNGEGGRAAEKLQAALAALATLKATDIPQTPAPGAGAGNVVQIQYNQIHTNLEGRSEFKYLGFLRQWIHINLTLSTGVDFFVMQAMAYPWGMAWGVFDIEFAAKDCGPEYDINVAKNLNGRALDLKGYAAVIPCHKRSYLHARHPYVYVYSGPQRSTFHVNYNFLDVTCRETKMLQFLIMSGADGKYNFVKTAVINHFNYHDSPDGMPYPFHVDMVPSLTMHDGNTFGFVTVKNGDKASFPYNKDFDDCILASNATFFSTYRETKDILSDWVCIKPVRYYCDFNKSENVPFWPGDTINSEGGPALCIECDFYDNNFTREVSARTIQRGYLARRYHGYAMILGTISASGVNGIIGRYFKETKGCCLLVGWWLWVHLALNFIAKGAVWGAFVLAIFLPKRLETTVPALLEPRAALDKLHSLIGVVSFAIFNAGWVTGLLRPKGEGCRNTFICLHVLFGYFTIISGLLAVIFSTACLEVKMYSIVSTIIFLIGFIIGLALQIIMDGTKRLVPPRKYFPVVEAIVVPREMPCCMARTLFLLAISIIMFFLYFLTVARGSYVGLINRDPCTNCKWKLDEQIRLPTGTGSTQMFDQFACVLADADFKKLL